MSVFASDSAAMLRALELGASRRGHVWPNPAVGCVVTKDGALLAEGVTQPAGQDHAEPDALRKLGFEARGATLHVTLEPCCHWGRTPPCTDAILRSGVSRVVVGVVDPNPLVAGRGVSLLREAGVRVDVGVAEDACRALHEAHFVRAQQGRPFVTLKTAATLDGRTATRTGASKWITGEAARAHGRRQRGLHQAVLVGVGTVLADDPQLNVRGPDAQQLPQPARVVADSALRTPPDSRLLRSAGGPVFILTTAAAEERSAPLREAGATILVAGEGPRMDLTLGLQLLAREHHITALFAEGGPTLHGALLDAGLVDRFLVYVAPKIFGGLGARAMALGHGIDDPAQARALAPCSVTRLGEDLLLETRPLDGPAGPWWAERFGV